MPRDAETVNTYLYETWDQPHDVPCPACGMPWLDTVPGRPSAGKTRFHKEDCDYNRWLDEDDMDEREATDA